MCVWSIVEKCPGFHGVITRRRGQPRQNLGHIGDDASKAHQRGAKLERKSVGALDRFISRVMDKCLPFFKTLKRAFEWTDKCQKAFEELKAYLVSLQLLCSSKLSEELSLYLVVSLTVASSAFIQEEDCM